MKVLICAGNSLRYCPYVNLYIEVCKKNHLDFCVVYPDRANLNDEFDYNTIRYEWNHSGNKTIELVKYIRLLEKELYSGEYGFTVVLTTSLAVLFSKCLLKKQISYIVDVRDYTHEKNKLYYMIEEKVIQQAKCVVISSARFRRFLPKRKYIEVFNCPKEIEKIYTFKKKREDPIIISYIGTIAYPDQCERLIRLVEKDTRFRFYLYGNDSNGGRIQAFISSNSYHNSRYMGAYQPYEKSLIIEKTDILFNAYGNDSPLLLYALSNKLTDAAIYKKVVLNSPGTYMDEILGVCSYAVNLEYESSLDSLYTWYRNLKSDCVEDHLNKLIYKIIKTNEKSKELILETITNR